VPRPASRAQLREQAGLGSGPPATAKVGLRGGENLCPARLACAGAYRCTIRSIAGARRSVSGGETLRVSYVAELGARACTRAPRVVLAVVVCGTVLALLAPIASGAGAPSDRVARVAASCSNETVNPGFGKPITLRFVLHGVSCNTGHHLIHTYFHDIATKTCRGRGTTCIFEYPGGWDCSSPPPSFPISASHRFAVCELLRGRPTASVTVYRVTAKSGGGVRHLSVFMSPDKRVWCDISRSGSVINAFCDTGNYGGNGFHSGNVVPDGKVTICNHPHAGRYCGALGGRFPVLRFGQRDELLGFRCTSATNGITCTVLAGTGRGKGFRINQDQAVKVG
jgi:hypothetical protein